MIALDTTVLLAFEIKEHPAHQTVRTAVTALARQGTPCFALAPQVLDEFLHVATDTRRFRQALGMGEAIERARFWWHANEVDPVFPCRESVDLATDWLARFSLGRKRILDTALAATYHVAGLGRLATANRSDFEVFDVFSFEDWAQVP